MTTLLREVQSYCLIRAWRIGLWKPPDRRLLDDVILPFYASAEGFERILFVGVKKYNAKNRALFAARTYATIDPDPRNARHGASRHIQDGLENLARHAEPSSFDVIVANGVFGAGLDAPHAVDDALRACHDALRPGGHLVVGVNDETPACPDFDALDAMRLFAPLEGSVLGSARHVLETPLRERTHTYRFYRRP